VIGQIIILLNFLKLVSMNKHFITSFHIWSEVILNKEKKIFGIFFWFFWNFVKIKIKIMMWMMACDMTWHEWCHLMWYVSWMMSCNMKGWHH
jgi:hypothetical protein